MTIEKLLSRGVRQPNGCLLIGRPSGQRYWNVRIGQRLTRAHIAIFESGNGPVPEGKEVCHTCDNTRCIEPLHLYAGTHEQNMMDSAVRHRRPPSKSLMLRIRVKPSFKARVKDLARRHAQTISLLLRSAVVEYLDRQEAA